jgi:hypothetical protein
MTVLMARLVILARLEQVVPQGMLVVPVTPAIQVILVITVYEGMLVVLVVAIQVTPALQGMLEKEAEAEAVLAAALAKLVQSVLAKP